MQRGFAPDSEGFINLDCDWKFLAAQVGGRTKAPKCSGNCIAAAPEGT